VLGQGVAADGVGYGVVRCGKHTGAAGCCGKAAPRAAQHALGMPLWFEVYVPGFETCRIASCISDQYIMSGAKSNA
jgi:hypothetical protein